jgi:hypothetical protein
VEWNAERAGIDIVSTDDDDAVHRSNQFGPEVGISGQDDGEAAGGYDRIDIGSAHLMARPPVLVTGNVRGNADAWSGGMSHV